MALANGHTESSRRVLIVDDDADTVQSTALIFDFEGHKTKTALTGVAALALGATFQPDLVLLDIAMPEMDGFTVASAMRATDWGDRAVIAAVTGYGPSERYAECGFDCHLWKPVNYARIAGVLAANSQRLSKLRREFEALKIEHASALASFVRLEFDLTRRFLDVSAVTQFPITAERARAKAHKALAEAKKWIDRGLGVSQEERLELTIRHAELARRLKEQ